MLYIIIRRNDIRPPAPLAGRNAFLQGRGGGVYFEGLTAGI